MFRAAHESRDEIHARNFQLKIGMKSEDGIKPVKERETNIKDAFFVVDMTGYPAGSTSMPDMPASYHNKAGGLSFADGHSEIKKWRDLFTTQPVKRNEDIVALGTGPRSNQDVRWMQEHATRER